MLCKRMLRRKSNSRFLAFADEEIVRALERWQQSPLNPRRRTRYELRESKLRQFAERRQRAQEKGQWATLFAATSTAIVFYASNKWKRIRFQAIQKYRRTCCSCGRTPDHGVFLQVDHIKPRFLYPELAFDINNLQILCQDCNFGKGLNSTRVIRRPGGDRSR